MAKLEITKELLKRLEAEGYSIKRKVDWIRKTFVIDREVVEKFLETQKKSGLKQQEAVTQALAEWLEKHAD